MPVEYIMLEYLDQNPITYQEIVRWTRKDIVFRQVLLYIPQGWPEKCLDSEKFHPYITRKHDFGMVGKIAFCGGNGLLHPYKDVSNSEKNTQEWLE